MNAPAVLHAALLTGAGRGAVAVVGLCGPTAAAIVARHFVSISGTTPTFPLDRVRFGRWLHNPDDREAPGEELVVCRRGDDDFEIHCHGGVAAVDAILTALSGDGATIVDWKTWQTAREADPIAAEARIALASAVTQRTASILVDQWQGALRRAIDAIHAHHQAGNTAEARAAAERLLARAALGRRLTSPFRVVLCGRPNVGKSSLINALVGYDRALVFDQPGTTRDVVTAATALDGWPIELSDTAGIRASDDELEAAGIAAARRRIAEADLIVIVCDAGAPWSSDDAALAAEHPRAILVFNQCDRMIADERRPPGLLTCALDRRGVPELIAEIVRRLVPDPPQPGEAVPFTARQIGEIERVRDNRWR